MLMGDGGVESGEVCSQTVLSGPKSPSSSLRLEAMEPVGNEVFL